MPTPGPVAVVLLLALSATTSLATLAEPAERAGAWPIALALAIVLTASLAAAGILRRRPNARTLVTLWAAAVTARLVIEDTLAGFARPGLPMRLAALALVAALLAIVVTTVPRRFGGEL
jgi:hypothetical protein